jgi:hypothetical protein
LGVKDKTGERADGLDLVTAIASRFERIGARFPQPQAVREAAAPAWQREFAALLAEQIPYFARSIRSIYVFTNQVPLLAANLTSPFRRPEEVGAGFKRFLQLRKPENPGADAADPLQVVAFHDPDDVLSYNLRCWYHVALLKDLEPTKKVIESEATDRAKAKYRHREQVHKSGETAVSQPAPGPLHASLQQTGTHTDAAYDNQKLDTIVGTETRALRDFLFKDNCSNRTIGTERERERALLGTILERAEQETLLSLKDATVRLRGWRLEGLAVDPRGVHSNYFHDSSVHEWLVNGRK